MRYVALAALILLTGCRTDVIQLRNEKTGEKATCGGLLMMPGRSTTENCLKVFREAGFREVSKEAK